MQCLLERYGPSTQLTSTAFSIFQELYCQGVLIEKLKFLPTASAVEPAVSPLAALSCAVLGQPTALLQIFSATVLEWAKTKL